MSDYNLTKTDVIELMLLPTFNAGCLALFDMYVERKPSHVAIKDAGLMFGSSLTTEILDKFVVQRVTDAFGNEGTSQLMQLGGRAAVNSLLYKQLYDQFFIEFYKNNTPYHRDKMMTYAIGAAAGGTQVLANPLMSFITGLQIL